MKYKDNKFVNYQDKQRNGEFGIYNGFDYCSSKTNRQIRREREHNWSVFYMSKISNHIDHIKDEYKPNKASYRQDKLKVLGI